MPSKHTEQPREARDHSRGGTALRRLYVAWVRALDGLHALPVFRWWHARLHAWVEYTSTDVLLERGEAGLHGLRVALVSDLHVGFFTTANDLARLGERLAVLAPDLVCLGGDLITTRREEVAALEHLLAHLQPPLGVFAVPGNHEHAVFRREAGATDLAPWRAQLADLGVTVLLNHGVRVEREGASFWLAGVEDDNEGSVDLEAALTGRRDSEPVVLLSHNPDVFPRAAERGVDLQVSGHTHGGQVRVLDWAPLTNSREGFLAGHYLRGSSQLFVGRGVGTSILPLRIGVRPEVAVLRLLIRP